MKAYKNAQGEISLFRPDKNMARLNGSATRIALPGFDGDALIELIKELVRLDERFIPAYVLSPSCDFLPAHAPLSSCSVEIMMKSIRGADHKRHLRGYSQ